MYLNWNWRLRFLVKEILGHHLTVFRQFPPLHFFRKIAFCLLTFQAEVCRLPWSCTSHVVGSFLRTIKVLAAVVSVDFFSCPSKNCQGYSASTWRAQVCALRICKETCRVLVGRAGTRKPALPWMPCIWGSSGFCHLWGPLQSEERPAAACSSHLQGDSGEPRKGSPALWYLTGTLTSPVENSEMKIYQYTAKIILWIILSYIYVGPDDLQNSFNMWPSLLCMTLLCTTFDP